MLSRVVTILLLCFGLGHHLNAQTWFLTLITPPSVTVSNNITYSMALENRSGLFLSPVFVTNVFPTSLQFVGATSNGTTVTVAPGNVTFNITGGLQADQTFPFTLTLRPTRVGPVTNVVTATTPTAVSNITLQGVTVVNPPVARSDLTVSITPPTSSVFVNDWVPYTLKVSRSGPDPISGVFLTNLLPAGAILRGYSPSNAVTVSSPRVIFDLGTMSLQSTQVNLTIQPTTGTNVTLVAIVGSPAGSETNTVNNSTTNTLSVLQPVPGQLEATFISNQVYNRQNSLVEQLIQVQNVSASNAVSARVVITNFPYRVVNAVGTNDGNPFVVHGGMIGTNETAELLLEYAIPDRSPKDNPGLTTYSAGDIDLTAPSGGTNIPVRMVYLPANDLVTATNRVLIEFPAERGATYLILYSTSTNTMFGDPRKAQPPIVAQANRVQWIDYGPPKTLTRPTNVMRFYQVIRLP